MPSGQDIEVYHQYIYGLPLVENPEISGLHTNADLVYCTQLTSNVLTPNRLQPPIFSASHSVLFVLCSQASSLH